MDNIIELDWLNAPIKITTGEMHTLVENSGETSKYYVALAEVGSNTILFHYTDASQNTLDYVDSIINGLPDFAKNYLAQVVNDNDNLLIHWSQYPNTDSGYTIYYDCDCENKDLIELPYWMQVNNDFAFVDYRYTEVKNGHQMIVGQN